MIVFIVIGHDWEDDDILGVYLDKATATDHSTRENSGCGYKYVTVEEHELIEAKS